MENEFKHLTAVKAKNNAIKANREAINEAINLIEAASKKGESSIKLENPKTAVLQFLQSLGYEIKHDSSVRDDFGDICFTRFFIMW